MSLENKAVQEPRKGGTLTDSQTGRYSAVSLSSGDKSSNPSQLNPAQLQQLQRLRGIKPKEVKKGRKEPSSRLFQNGSQTKSTRSTESKSETSETHCASDNPLSSQRVAVNYRELNSFKQPIMNGSDYSGSLPVNNVADVLTQVKQISEGKTEKTKPLVICAKATSPHVQVTFKIELQNLKLTFVQALNERYIAQEAELQKADRERERKDAIEKGNSSAPSDSSIKSATTRHKPRGGKRQPSPKPRTEEWVQQHMNQQAASTDDEIHSDEQKLRNDYETRKHLYE